LKYLNWKSLKRRGKRESAVLVGADGDDFLLDEVLAGRGGDEDELGAA
jgi:hypothetical protein